MKIDLCKIFGVEEGEEFRIEMNTENLSDLKYTIKDNTLLSSKLKKDNFNWSSRYINDINEITNIIKLPKKKFTDDELCILRNIDKEYKWIAKDKDDDYIYAYENKPYKKEESWTGGNNAGLYCFDKLFPTITWEDEEPVYIDDYVER